MGRKIAFIRGDGVGPELTACTMTVFEAVNPQAEVILVDAGYEWWLRHGGPSLIPPETWEVLRAADAIIKAPTTTPTDPGSPRSVAVSIRQAFDLYANIRPIRTYRGLPSLFGELDFICVRETTEDLYSGIEHRITPDVAIAVRKNTRTQSEKVARKAFSIAKEKGWNKVIVVTKRNIMRECDGVFVEAVDRVSKEFPGITYEEYFVDNMAQQLVKNPDRFNHNVILGTNMFMDILSEEAAGLIASIGMIYSGNFGDEKAMFEPAHGSAPKYKGQDKVNPTATILSAAWALEYVGEKEKARAIFQATEEVIAEGKVLTYDLKGTAKSSEMARAIAEKAAKLLKR